MQEPAKRENEMLPEVQGQKKPLMNPAMDLLAASMVAAIWIFAIPTPHGQDYWAKNLIIFIVGAGWFVYLDRWDTDRRKRNDAKRMAER